MQERKQQIMTDTDKETLREETKMLKEAMEVALMRIPGQIVKIDPQIYQGPTKEYAGLGMLFGWTKYHDYVIPFAIKITDNITRYFDPKRELALVAKDLMFWSIQTPAEKAFWQAVTQDYSNNLAQSVQKFLGKDSRQLQPKKGETSIANELKILAKMHDLPLTEFLDNFKIGGILTISKVAIPKILFSAKDCQKVIKETSVPIDIDEVDVNANAAEILLKAVNDFAIKYQDQFDFAPVKLSLTNIAQIITADWQNEHLAGISIDQNKKYRLAVYLDSANFLEIVLKDNNDVVIDYFEQELPNNLMQTCVQLADYLGQTQFKNVQVTV